jgi:hypothetical protein
MSTLPFKLDNLSLRECYGQLENDINISYDTHPDGKTSILVEDHWHYHQMPAIDEFVRNVLGTTSLAFTREIRDSGKIVYVQQELARKHFRIVSDAISIGLHDLFDVRNVFVDLFVSACHELKILTWNIHVLSRPGRIAHVNAECFNELIDFIRLKAKEPAFRSRIRHAKEDPERNFEECKEYVHYLFNKPGGSRYMVLRLDLGYRTEIAFNVFTQEAKDDLRRLFSHGRQNKRLFGDLAGYIWKIEYGTDRFLHFHLVLFFTKKNASKHGYWAQEVGKYWKTIITKGRGTFHNCNFDVSKYRRCGIGEVNRSDTEKIANLIGAIGYFFKAEQCIPIPRSGPHFRTFGKGERK